MSELPVAVTIRPFEARDRPQVESLWACVFADDPPWNDPAAMIRSKLRVQPELLLVAATLPVATALLGDATLPYDATLPVDATDAEDGEVAPAIVGAVIAGFDGVRGWIHHLAVAPAWRRRGIATRLVRAAESGLRRLGCPKVNLQVRATNAEVVAFYRSLGYGIEDRVSMGRRLEGGP